MKSSRSKLTSRKSYKKQSTKKSKSYTKLLKGGYVRDKTRILKGGFVRDNIVMTTRKNNLR